MDHEDKMFLKYIAAFIALWAAAVVVLAFVSSHFDAASMREVGYEAKAITGSCYAKFKDRWVSCSTVVNNQINVTKE